ncbi:MAG: response regulator [Oscillospiraceae bacterium]|nr:response regulator [Oscillospiraceae bacterium]
MQDNKRQKIMLVDDNMTSLTMGKNILKEHYEVYALPSTAKLFDFLKRVKPDLILMDIEMPGMNGYEAVTILKSDSQHADIPVIFVTAKNSESDEFDGLALGAIDYVTKPFSSALLLKRIENQLLIQKQKARLQDFNDNLLKIVEEKTKQIFGFQNSIINTVADLVEFRDNSTGWHITRTQKYFQAMAEQLIKDDIYTDELLSWDIDVASHSAQLHDVGKISISDMILHKPGKLTPEEFEIMKTHVDKGVEAIERMEIAGHFADFLNHAKIIAGTHHEKWNGSGYPQGLSGESIPLEGRIMAVADVYDALISVRPYKKAFPAEEAIRIIVEDSGVHFDPLLIDTFKKLTDEFARIAKEYGNFA